MPNLNSWQTSKPSTEAEKGQSKNILQIPKNISNRKVFSKITVEEFVKSKKLLQVLRKLLDQ